MIGQATAIIRDNREEMLAAIRHHLDYVHRLKASTLATDAELAWSAALTLGRVHGYRNSQATLLAPTGTIAFMMDCDTTGVEPDIALVKYKNLVAAVK